MNEENSAPRDRFVLPVAWIAACAFPALVLFADRGDPNDPAILFIALPGTDVEETVAAAGGWIFGVQNPILGVWATAHDTGFPARVRALGGGLTIRRSQLPAFCSSRL